jgi:hypothetical protein
MALGKDFRNLKGDFEKLNQESVQFQSDLVDIEKTIRQVAKGSKDFESAMGNAAATVKQSQKFAEDLTKASTENLKSQKEIDKIKRKQAKLLGVEQSINARINSLLALRVKQGSQEETNIKNVVKRLYDAQERLEKINDGYSGILDKSDKIAKSNPFKGLADLVSDIPVINKLLGNLTTASEKYNNAITDQRSRTEALAEGVGEYIKLLSKAILVAGFKEAKDAIVLIDNSSKSLAANLGISKQQAVGLTQQFTDQSKNLKDQAMTYRKIMEAQGQLVALAQVQTTFSGETASAFSVLTKNIGLSADISEKLRSISVLTGSSLEDQVKDTMGLVRFNNQKFGIAVSEKTVMTEIASLSSNIAMSMAAQGKNLASSVYQAQKLGLSMQQIEKTAGSLLDFESSITNELEAELLIGRDLNFERARLAALNNDMGRVAEEINKQGITASSFKLMNSIQQNSIAKSLGMTASQMGDMFARQATFSKLGVSDIGGVAEIIAEMRASGATDKEIQDRIGDQGMIDAANNLTMKEQIRDLIDNLAEKVMPALLKVLNALDSLLEFLGGDGGRRVGKVVTQAAAIGITAKVAGGVRGAAALSRMGGMFSKTAGAAGAAGPALQTGKFASGSRAGQQFFKVGGKFASESSFKAAQAASKSGSAAAKTAGNVGRFAKFGGAAMKGLGRLAVPLTVAGVGFDAYSNFTNDKLTAEEAAMRTLDQNKGLATGALVGTMIMPGIGTAIGATIGGLADIIMPEIGVYGDEGLAEQKKTNELLAANNKQLMEQTNELYEAISRARSVSIDGDLLTSNAGISNTGGGRNIM